MKTWFSITAKADTKSAEIDIFDEIGLWGVTVKDFATALKSVPEDHDLTLRINSPGGSVFDGFAIFNLLSARRERVTAHVIGLAASMASIIMLAGKRVIAAENATVMIHKPSGGAWGESSDMREMADLLDKLEGTLVNTYVTKTGKTEDEVKAAMAATTWFTAAEAKEWGLIDEVSAAVKAKATFDLTRFGKLPANISGCREATTNHQPKVVAMKALLKALAEAKLVASTDVSEDTAVAQFGAAFSAQADAVKDLTTEVADLKAKLKAADEKIAASLKASAESTVEAAVKAGSIKDDTAVRAKWVEAYIRDEASTKAMLDGLTPAAPKGRGNPPVVVTKTEGEDPSTSNLKGAARVAAAFSNVKP